MPRAVAPRHEVAVADGSTLVIHAEALAVGLPGPGHDPEDVACDLETLSDHLYCVATGHLVGAVPPSPHHFLYYAPVCRPHPSSRFTLPVHHRYGLVVEATPDVGDDRRRELVRILKVKGRTIDGALKGLATTAPPGVLFHAGGPLHPARHFFAVQPHSTSSVLISRPGRGGLLLEELEADVGEDVVDSLPSAWIDAWRPSFTQLADAVRARLVEVANA